MKKLLLFFLLLLTLLGCGDRIERPYVTENNDTISREFLITDSRVGHLRRGMSASSLRKAYGEQYVKQLQMRRNSATDTVTKPQEYYVYDKNNKLLFIAETSSKDLQSEEIDLVMIKDPRFRTTKNIGVNSSISKIKNAYRNLDVVQDDDYIAIYIPSVDGYLRINPDFITGYNPNFIADIPIDSVSNNAKPLSFTISWYRHDEGILSSGFWKETMRKILVWMIMELPMILVIVALFVILLRSQKYIIQRVRKIAINRATKDTKVDSHEALKRIDTLAEIGRAHV